ncbi:hypothetical protein A2U01_0091083, partial [Trifolium medium]|nr:hypothetical protein [Trifolium medium]
PSVVCLGRKAPGSGAQGAAAGQFCYFVVCLFPSQCAGRAAHCAGISGKCSF